MDAVKSHHPKLLPYCFLTEMWERFGFYVVQGLLILYLTQALGMTDNESYTILGAFTAFVYISPIVGGYLASNVLGYKTSIVWGGLFLIIGYALLALPYTKSLLYPALATIIVGNGFFKPNISSLLGTQYEINAANRDAGFTIFYIGINIGALLAGLSSGYIKDYFGWRVCFSLASIGLVIGLVTFFLGLKYLKDPQPNLITSPTRKVQILIACLLAIVALTFVVKIPFLADWLMPIIGIIILLYLVFLILREGSEYRQSLILLTILILSSVVYWTLFFQLFYAANLFVDRLVDRHVLGLYLATTVFYGSESVYIILLGPLFAWGWQALSRHRKNPATITKFYLGIFSAGLGFLVLAFATHFPNEQQLIEPYWVFFSYFLITIGELLLSPIGLSAVTVLAPAHLVGLMMGIWFVAIGFGGMFAGSIAKIASIPDTMHDHATMLTIYQNAFFDYAYLAFIVTIILFFVQLAFRKKLTSNS